MRMFIISAVLVWAGTAYPDYKIGILMGLALVVSVIMAILQDFTELLK